MRGMKKLFLELTLPKIGEGFFQYVMGYENKLSYIRDFVAFLFSPTGSVGEALLFNGNAVKMQSNK